MAGSWGTAACCACSTTARSVAARARRARQIWWAREKEARARSIAAALCGAQGDTAPDPKQQAADKRAPAQGHTGQRRTLDVAPPEDDKVKGLVGGGNLLAGPAALCAKGTHVLQGNSGVCGIDGVENALIAALAVGDQRDLASEIGNGHGEEGSAAERGMGEGRREGRDLPHHIARSPFSLLPPPSLSLSLNQPHRLLLTTHC